uniref:Ubiquitin-like protease family profile domain-containing protein n=1 Tax=Setaria italica TaxID=4555 RepID=K3YZM7_SETIT
MSMYVSCLIDDESYHGPDTVGYRIFLYPKISVSENFILLPVCHNSYWTVYIINKSYGQIDVLDSGSTVLKDKQKWHTPVASKIRTRLGEAILKITQSKFNFSSWSMPVITGLPRQDSNDSRFFAMMFLKHYNPDTRKMAFCELNKKNLRNLRCNIL